MLDRFFHTWERRLVAVDSNRVVRPFEWGLEWVDPTTDLTTDPADHLERWATRTLSDTAWFSTSPCHDYEMRDDRLTFPSEIQTPHTENNHRTRAVLPGRAAVGPPPRERSCSRSGMPTPTHTSDCAACWRGSGSARCGWSLPYHDARMPAELQRADYIMSANIGRTLQVNRQAVLDARRAIAWLVARGYDRVGILGTSLGSCLAMLTAAHEPLIKAAALNHISPYFADVVWEGLSDRTCPRRARRGNRPGPAAASVAADQPAPICGSPSGHPGAPGLRSLRSVVSGPVVPPTRRGLRATRHPPRRDRAALRSLTPPERPRSSGWTATSWSSSCDEICRLPTPSSLLAAGFGLQALFCWVPLDLRRQQPNHRRQRASLTRPFVPWDMMSGVST